VPNISKGLVIVLQNAYFCRPGAAAMRNHAMKSVVFFLFLLSLLSFLGLLILGTALAMGGAAWAAGVEHPDLGTIAIGRGGAYAADPDEGLALQYNPAGFGRQAGLRATLGGDLAWQRMTFTPSNGDGAVSNGAPPFLAPAVVVSYGLRDVGPLPGLTFALGATGPTAIGKLEYPAAGAQRYALISSDTTIIYWSAAVAAAFNRWLAAGVTFQLVKGTARFTQAVWSGESMGTDPGEDAIAHVDVTSGFIPTAVFGVTARPTERVSIGLSYRPRFTFDASGSLETDLPNVAGALAAHQIGTDTGFTLPMPDVFRAGVLVRPRARWLVEADVVLERWSTLQSLALRPHGIVIASDNLGTSKPLPDIVFQKNFDDAWSLRLGGEHELVPGRLTLRAGWLYETSAVPLASTSVDFPNWERNVVSVGASVAVPRTPVTVDVAYAHHFLPSRTVSASGITQVVTPCLTPGCSDPAPTVVGNGRYEASFDVISLSLRMELPARGP
jgi:long-chain fatty acid transport protein